MHDPIQQPPDQPGTLFHSTSRKAGAVAARFSGYRYRRILEVLHEHGPLCIFEVAAILGCNDHQISGRFGELYRNNKIQKTGQRKTKPDTGCECEVYAIVIP